MVGRRWELHFLEREWSFLFWLEDILGDPKDGEARR